MSSVELEEPLESLARTQMLKTEWLCSRSEARYLSQQFDSIVSQECFVPVVYYVCANTGMWDCLSNPLIQPQLFLSLFLLVEEISHVSQVNKF